MTHVIEAAVSGRARCRGCGGRIAKDSLRFGERLPNPYGEGDTTVWYHPRCAAYRRPEPFLEALTRGADGLDDAEALRRTAELSRAHRRLCRLGPIEQASSGRARCRACRELIDRDAWRIPLLFYEEGMFNASGFVHLTCAPAYFETGELLDCIRHFQPALEDADTEEIAEALSAASA